MNILAIGDIIGDVGLKKVKEFLPKIKNDYNIDFVIANGENTADGMGMSIKQFNELINLKIDVVTMGNHTWAKKDIFAIIDNPKIVRPANYSENVPGNGYGIYEIKNKKIAVINLIGRVDINVLSDNPFTCVETIINNIKEKVDIIIVDFHAEATAEKIAMSYFLDGKVSAIFGTHTHVQTSDEQILENGTAYITDIGMTGPKKSVIGMSVDVSIKRFLTSLPERYKISDDTNSIFNGCVFKINDENCKVQEVIRIKM
ncbi:MAG: TIGR00282 family metallophosphoesterase [Lachnospiraceae bacterium]|jgi:metallophosphoesterase (TIGR00282 family)|nr:TIGR00282 family metallophosphoesterase [Lachnospiraceae bacterium]